MHTEIVQMNSNEKKSKENVNTTKIRPTNSQELFQKAIRVINKPINNKLKLNQLNLFCCFYKDDVK